ncbi:type II toxin-antitoxin system RelE/ParE family toxin [Candidatus Peregrinibacteria bacterium]|nr:type II toxin-antitoxin system RelE/ParE family toxin [Candidatus Peregrinibacteria bacterium]
MTYILRYSAEIDFRRFAKLPKKDRVRIRKAIEQKLTTHPEIFGKPLRQSLKGCRSLRVGSYRVVYRIVGRTVEVLLFGHRSGMYEEGEVVL